ncbi:MAG: helix-turn-helix transcriptional regulator [Solirubrobacterales bacterium]
MAAAEDVAVRFGSNLLRYRRRAGFSQEEVSLLASLHRTEIGLLENGRRVPRIDTLVKLTSALSVEAKELLDGIEWVVGDLRVGSFITWEPSGLRNP